MEGKDDETKKKQLQISQLEGQLGDLQRSLSSILRQHFLDYENHDRHTGAQQLIDLIAGHLTKMENDKWAQPPPKKGPARRRASHSGAPRETSAKTRTIEQLNGSSESTLLSQRYLRQHHDTLDLSDHNTSSCHAVGQRRSGIPQPPRPKNQAGSKKGRAGR